MKKLIIPCLLFLAFTFSSTPPGWYQQTLPVNRIISDIFFIDSLKGWATTEWGSQADTGYILHTTNGGTNWLIQYKAKISLLSIQFLNKDTGYAGGGDGFPKCLKTTNGGVNWILTTEPPNKIINNLFFVNAETGWIIDDNSIFGGIFKTLDGGNNWVRQTNPDTKPASIFMLNQDTGWYGAHQSVDILYRTTNGGVNWISQFSSAYAITSIFFLNKNKGWIRGGTPGSYGAAYTTNGGFNWTDGGGEYFAPLGYDIKFINDSIGYSGATSFKMPKSTDGGKTWGYQIIPQAQALQVAILKNDTNRIWGGSNGLIHTIDGGGPIMDVRNITTEIPTKYSLSQNYPNPFNPTTKISFSVKRKTANVKLQIYDATGKLISELINQSFNAGTYEVDFNANNLSSGVYFYTLVTDDFKETKRMVLLK